MSIIKPKDKRFVLNEGIIMPSDLNYTPSNRLLKILKASDFTCSCCGLKSRRHTDYPSGFIEVLEVNEGDNKTYCTICIQSISLDREVNGMKEHGHIILCPQLTQGQVSHFARMHFLSQINDNMVSDKSAEIYELMASELTKNIGTIIPGYESGSIEEYIDIYNYLPPAFKSGKTSVVDNLRYLPKQMAYDKQTRFWKAASYRGLEVE